VRTFARIRQIQREPLEAAALFAVGIVLLYGDVVFLGFSLSPALYIRVGVVPYAPYGYHGRASVYSIWMDALASGAQNWPVYVLISKVIASGVLPLWNPFQGGGAPLAADVSWSTYFPLDLLNYLLPNQYWDFVWLLKLWAAAFLCYEFTKSLGLGHVASLGAGFAYSLSGAFIFYPFLPWTNVAVMTPALLFAAKKCFDHPLRADSLALGGAVFAFSLLGAHIEALTIQFLFVGMFVVFEAMTRQKGKLKGILSWVAVLLLGFGLASFFLFPVFEYVQLAFLGHTANVGIRSVSNDGNPVIWWVSLFIPYFYGFLQTYPYQNLRDVFFWDISPGYLGITVFFLSVLPLLSIRYGSWKCAAKKYYVFFLSAAVLVLMKIFGVPPLNLIGYLPVLMYVIFSRYSGSVLAMSFAVSCAFGLEVIGTSTVRNWVRPLLFVLVGIALGIVLTVPFPVSPNSRFFPVSVAYLGAGMLFLVLAAFTVKRGGSQGPKILVALVLLELASYVPRGLSVTFEAARVLVLLGGAFMVVSLCITRGGQELMQSLCRILPRVITKKRLLGSIIIAVLIVQFVIASASPSGLPNRYDPYVEAPFVRFLQQNVGYQRVYSLDGAFFPSVAGIFQIESLGTFSGLMPADFRNFSLENLDPGAIATNFVGNAWNRNESISPAVEIHQNLASYSLLGVKYFVTAGTDLAVVRQISIVPVNAIAIKLAPIGPNNVSTQFLTDVPFDGIIIEFGTYGHPSVGSVTLKLDSIPENLSYHRESNISAASIHGGVSYLFPFPLVNTTKRTLFELQLSQSDTDVTNEVAVAWWPQLTTNTHLAITEGSLNIPLSLVLRDPNMSTYMPIVYQDSNVTIYQNLKVFPRAFLAEGVIVASDEGDAVQRTKELGWSTRDTVVIDGGNGSIPLQSNTKNASMDSGNAQITQYGTNQVNITVEATRQSFLVLTDVYYPGWTAFIDGAQTPIYRAYGVVRAIFVPQGIHQVVYKYEPESFKEGSAISLVSVVILLGLVIRMKRRSRKS